ncbi:MAG: hypothetical protein HY000_04060 [Planctomycetes bacterium]|nr:hypothetical protein [Planctomycetota bacterium]
MEADRSLSQIRPWQWLLIFVGVACTVAVSPGCSRWTTRRATPHAFSSETPTANEIIAVVNGNAGRAQALLAKHLDILVREGGHHIAVPLKGKLALEKPRRFRLIATNPLGGREADLGSNDDEFWCYVRRGAERPTLMHCSYAEYPGVRTAIPFQPDWVIESIGLSPLPAEAQHTVQPGKRGTIEVVTPTTTPQGQYASKITAVQLSSGLIVERRLEVAGRRVATAVLSRHRPDSAFGVVYPGSVAISWPEAGLELSIDLEDVVVNPQFEASTAASLWTIPRGELDGGAEDIDLAAPVRAVRPVRTPPGPAGPQSLNAEGRLQSRR